MPDPADQALAAAITTPLPDERVAGVELVTLAELADRAGMPLAVLEAIEREGLLVPRVAEPEPRYAARDVEVVQAGVDLLQAGLPLGELLDLARRFDTAMGEVADDAVELFARFVKDPVEGTAEDGAQAAEALVDRFQTMLPATSKLVAHRFHQLVLARARARLED